MIRHRALWAVSVYIILARSARVGLQVFRLLSLHGFGLQGDLGTGLTWGMVCRCWPGRFTGNPPPPSQISCMARVDFGPYFWNHFFFENRALAWDIPQIWPLGGGVQNRTKFIVLLKNLAFGMGHPSKTRISGTLLFFVKFLRKCNKSGSRLHHSPENDFCHFEEN